MPDDTLGIEIMQAKENQFNQSKHMEQDTVHLAYDGFGIWNKIWYI